MYIDIHSITITEVNLKRYSFSNNLLVSYLQWSQHNQIMVYKRPWIAITGMSGTDCLENGQHPKLKIHTNCKKFHPTCHINKDIWRPGGAKGLYYLMNLFMLIIPIKRSENVKLLSKISSTEYLSSLF